MTAPLLNDLEVLLSVDIFDKTILQKFSDYTISDNACEQYVLKNDIVWKTQGSTNERFMETFATGFFYKTLTRLSFQGLFAKMLTVYKLNTYEKFTEMYSFLPKEELFNFLVDIGLGFVITNSKDFKILTPEEKTSLLRKIFIKDSSYSLSFMKEFKGNWNEIGPNGLPLFFKINLDRNSAHQVVKFLTNPENNIDLSLKDAAGRNFLEYKLRHEEIQEYSGEIFSVNKYLKIDALKNSNILKNHYGEIPYLLLHFRWNIEKQSLPMLVQVHILKEVIEQEEKLKSYKFLVKAISEFEERFHESFFLLAGINPYSLNKDFLSTIKDSAIKLKYTESEYFDEAWIRTIQYISSGPHHLGIKNYGYFRVCRSIKDNPELVALRYDLWELKKLYKKSLDSYVKAGQAPSLNLKKVKNVIDQISREYTKLRDSILPFVPGKLRFGVKNSLSVYPRSVVDSLQSKSLEEFSEKVLGKKTGFALMQAKKYLITKTKVNCRKIFWARILTGAEFNYDLINSFLTSRKKLAISDSKNAACFIKLLKGYVDEKHVIKLITNTEHASWDIIEDTLTKLGFFHRCDVSPDVIKKMIKNSHCLKEVHDEFYRYYSRVNEQEHFSLPQESLKDLQNRELGEGLTLKVPMHSQELVDVGYELDICVGDGTYSESVAKGEVFIVTVYTNKDKPKYCIELMNTGVRSAPQIVQARGKGNSDMPKKFYKPLIEHLTQKSKKTEGQL